MYLLWGWIYCSQVKIKVMIPYRDTCQQTWEMWGFPHSFVEHECLPITMHKEILGFIEVEVSVIHYCFTVFKYFLISHIQSYNKVVHHTFYDGWISWMHGQVSRITPDVRDVKNSPPLSLPLPLSLYRSSCFYAFCKNPVAITAKWRDRKNVEEVCWRNTVG